MEIRLAIGAFVDRLREIGLLDRSVLVLYGDHQAFLGETPELAWLLGFSVHDEYHHWQVRKKVTLLIRLPYGEGGGVIDVTGGHLDIAPTVLNLLGITDDNSVMLGRDLTQGENSLVVFRDGSFADRDYYFINHFGSSTCYETRTGRILDCRALQERHRESLEQLAISDRIIQGDLIPALTLTKTFTAEEARGTENWPRTKADEYQQRASDR